jgi:FixJ family two-component response regulator
MSIAEPKQPTVLVIDDNADVRDGIRQLLESVGLRCEVFTSTNEFLRREPTNGPRCLVLDVRLPGMSGLEFLAQLDHGLPTVVITGHGDISMSVRAMKAGAVDFLTKPVREQDLLDAVYAGLERHGEQLGKEEKLDGLHARFEGLSSREREILPLVAAGLLNKQIAAEVGLSEVTVKVHRHKMMVKLNAKHVPDLVRIADTLAIRNNGFRYAYGC